MQWIRAWLKHKIVKNAGWLIFGKVAQMLLSLVVGVLSARYLGPGNYGLIHYATAYTVFFTSLCNLGINSVIVKELLDFPEDNGTIVGTAIGLRTLSSILSALTICLLSLIVDRGEPITVAVVALSSIGLIFNVFETFNYWYHSRLQSKRIVIGSLIAYIVTSAYKIILLITGRSVLWFALATAVDYVVGAIVMYTCYRYDGGQKLRFSRERGKRLLAKSHHYILPGLMTAIYAQTDKIMLKHMIDEAALGYYATAVTLCGMWTFVLTAVVDSLNPYIMEAHKADANRFRKLNKILYAITFWISMLVSLALVLLGDFVIEILYGADYLPAAVPLKVITWYTAFSYLGVARNAWIVCENKQKYLKYIYLFGAASNLILNLIMIPIWGSVGAAVASLVAQIVTSLVVPFCIKDLRENATLMLEAMFLRNVFPCGKSKKR